jgi:iron complex outermembrane receptor protein
MRVLLIHIALMLLCSISMAQHRIAGVVLDENKSPLPGVNIYIESLKRGTVTNMDGRFDFQVNSNEEVELRVSMIGFKTQRFMLLPGSDEAQELEIQMESITLQSTELIVSASRSATFSVLTPISATTLKAEDLQTRSILTLDEALQYVPGVQMAGDQVNIRGSSGYSYGVGSRVTLLIDGVPMLGADRGDVRFDGLPMSQVERVEIIKGPGSTLYGSGALSGVINLVTKDFPKKLEVTVRQVAGAYQPNRYEQWREQWESGDENRPLSATTFTIAAPIGERAGFWLNGVYRRDTGWLNALSREGGEIYGKFGWTSRKGTNVNVFIGAKRFFDGRFVYWNGLEDPLNPGSVRLANSESRGQFDGFSEMLTVAPTINQVVGDHSFLTIRGRAYGVAFRSGDSWDDIAKFEDSDVAVRYGGDVQYTWQPESGSELIAGIMYDANLAQSEYFVGVDGVTVRLSCL